MNTLALFASIGLLMQTSAQGALEPTQETGSRIYTQPKKQTDPKVIGRYTKRVATCTYTRLGDENVSEYLRASDPISTDLNGTGLDWNRLEQAMEFCMGYHTDEYNSDVRLNRVGMTLTRNRMRALMMEEAYLANNQTPISVSEGASELTSRTYVSTGEELSRAQGLGNYADCVVHRDAAGADALLRTAPASEEEKAAARALAPVLGGCLIDGQTIEFTPASIRALAADGLWARWAHGSKQEG